MTRRFRSANPQVVSSIEKQRLFEERATIDNLTRLHNRGWLNNNFDRLLNYCKTDGLPFSY
jgi:GGDEF domain-containing protein